MYSGCCYLFWLYCLIVHGESLQSPIPITNGVQRVTRACRRRVGTRWASQCSALSFFTRTLSLLCRNHPHLQFPLPGMFISQSFHLLEVFVLSAFISRRFPWLYNNAIYSEFLSPFPYLVSSKSLISLTLCISFVFFTSMGAGADFCLFRHCIISIHKSVLCIVGIQHVC